jgi:ribosomal protein L37E
MKKKIIKQGKTIRTCHDEDCPKCGFPETIDIRNAKTFEIIRRVCSKNCGWEISRKELDKLNKKKK